MREGVLFHVKSRLRWLHISDFHFGAGQPYDRDVVLRAQVESLPDIFNKNGFPHLIFATGDIAQSGRSSEYERVGDFFDSVLHAAKLGKDRLFVVPGNHDVDRLCGKGLSRTLSGEQEAINYFDPSEPLPHISARQAAYSKWFNKYFEGIREFISHSTCSKMETLDVEGEKVCILPINSAAFSFDDNDHGKLWVGRRCLDDALRAVSYQSDAVKFAIMHHPIDWLNSEELSNIKSGLRDNFDFILRGHLHENDVEQIVCQAGSCFNLAVGASYQTRKWPNTAMIVEVDDRKVSVTPIHYVDKPREAWTVDTSLYPREPEFRGVYELPVREADGINRPSDKQATSASESDKAVTPLAQRDVLRAEFEAELFVTPSGQHLYAEPNIMSRQQAASGDDDVAAHRISVAEIARGTSSYLIETRSEYGGSTLCGRLAYEISLLGRERVYKRDATKLPNYRKKLEAEFPIEANAADGTAVLVIDNLDLERDERLIKEIAATGWFVRVVAISVNRDIRPAKLIDIRSLPFRFDVVHLWTISRSDIRSIAKIIFSTSDENYLSPIVDKVYGDLLGLCIPLTPSNVIMYMRILFREGDFHPLNRVDIVSRYIQEVLRKPSDAYSENFNAKNKQDVVSTVVHRMYKDGRTDFDDRYWHDAIAAYQADTLTEFDGADLLKELEAARIVVRFRGAYYMKYQFYFSYFLGRHIYSRYGLLHKFLKNEDYLAVDGVVDVITGLSSDNAAVVEALTSKLERDLNDFSERYVKSEFDPLLRAIWPDNQEADEKIWATVSEQIASGPRDAKEIDTIKSSMVSEARTQSQNVVLEKFVDLETSLFIEGRILTDALRNSDDVPGPLKLRALDAVLKAHHVAYQIGSVFSKIISERNYFRWGGVAFLDFDKVGKPDDPSNGQLVIIDALKSTIACEVADTLGSKKLSAVFRAREKSGSASGFLDFLNFCNVLRSKGQNWEKTLTESIERTDKNAFYLASKLNMLMHELEMNFLQANDVAKIRRLVAVIQAKRSYGKQAPGAKAVSSMLNHLEQIGHFRGSDFGKK